MLNEYRHDNEIEFATEQLDRIADNPNSPLYENTAAAFTTSADHCPTMHTLTGRLAPLLLVFSGIWQVILL
jgi:hypothetical protein